MGLILRREGQGARVERDKPPGRPLLVIPPAGDIGANQAIRADLPRATILLRTVIQGLAGVPKNPAARTLGAPHSCGWSHPCGECKPSALSPASSVRQKVQSVDCCDWQGTCVHKTVGVIEILAPGNSPYCAHFPRRSARPRQATNGRAAAPDASSQRSDRQNATAHANQPIWTPGGTRCEPI